MASTSPYDVDRYCHRWSVHPRQRHTTQLLVLKHLEPSLPYNIPCFAQHHSFKRFCEVAALLLSLLVFERFVRQMQHDANNCSFFVRGEAIANYRDMLSGDSTHCY